MQLEFSFVVVFAEAEAKVLVVKEQLLQFFSQVSLADSIGRWMGGYYRSGEVFVYKLKPQLEFPHSEYWGFEQCEP